MYQFMVNFHSLQIVLTLERFCIDEHLKISGHPGNDVPYRDMEQVPNN